MADSDLKIFIVGPKKAGKTVFACMLNNYVSEQSKSGVVCELGDWITTAHFTEINEELSKQKWPLDTLPLKAGQEHIELKWEWKLGHRKAFFDLVDPAGEDIERAMRGEGNELPILSRIHAADVLFVLVDLHGHQGDTKIKRAQNAWIFTRALRASVNVRRLVIGISKGDLMAHDLPHEDWTDKGKLMELISKTMPEFNLGAHRSQLESSEVQMVMFSAVAAEAKEIGDGVLEWRPKQPLESHGLEPFVKAISEAHSSKEWDEFVQIAYGILKRLGTSKWFLALLAGLCALWWWFASHQEFKITFRTPVIQHAGTDGRVSLNLIGATGESGWMHFDGKMQSDGKDPFEQGRDDHSEFVRTVWSVGQIKKVIVRLDDPNQDGGWYLTAVEIEDRSDASKSIFPCERWLNNQDEVTLPK